MTSNNYSNSVNYTFTQKQIPRQTEKFNFLSANNVSVYHV